MSVTDLIQHFEGLKLLMDTKRERSTQKGNSKSSQVTHSSKMKRFITDITDIKRPTTKNKTAEDLEKSHTLPRSSRNPNQSNLKSNSTFKVTSNTQKVNNNYYNSIRTNNDIGCIPRKMQILPLGIQEFEDIVEEFGNKLRRKRFQLQNRQNEENVSSVVSKPEDVHEVGEASYLEPISVEEKLEEEITKPKCVQEEAGNSESVHDVGESPDVSSCNTEDECDGELSDDMFGYNTFEENEDDNYVVETYNKRGHELVITTMLITRRTIKHNEIDENIAKLIDNSDYVVHKNECERSDSEKSRIYENHRTAENDTNEDSPKPSAFLYNQIFENDPQLPHDDEVFYEEIHTEPYLPINTNHDTFNGGHEPEENQLFHENVSNFSVVDEDEARSKSAASSPNLRKRKKISYVIEEMIKTEEQYISGLEIVMKNYMSYMFRHTPQDLIGRTAYLFGNIDAIYSNAKKLLVSMKNNCDSADSLAQVFIDSASEFELYPLYSKNKPTADMYIKQFDLIIKERQRQLDDKLGLASYLLTPIQRLGKYVLLLEQMKKELKKDGDPLEKISAAISVVRNVMRKGNDYIAIDSIKQSEIDLTTKGSFIMRTPFNILKPRRFESMVFLFENIIVFTEKTYKHLEFFKYVDNIPMSDLSLARNEDKPNIFHLTNYIKLKKAHPDATYVLEADTPKVKKEWVYKIEDILWSQLEKVKEQQKRTSKPTNQKHTAKSRTLSTSEVNLRTRKSYRPAAKSKSKFYDDNT